MSSKRILIVEDEGIVAANLEDLLKRLGYTVAGKAATGRQAIEETARLRPDLVLMDIILKGQMDGVEAAREITKNYDVPVVYLTAHADDLTRQRAQLTGPFGYVVKPFDERELHVGVEIALYRAEAENKLKTLNLELNEALAEIKTLYGLLPICAWCKKIQNEKGEWEKLESYLESHSNAEFTHGICPDCLAKKKETLQAERNSEGPQP